MSESDGDSLVEIVCSVRYNTDTSVTWLRNGYNVTSTRGYGQRTAVENRLSFRFSYYLIVSDVVGYMGLVNYTCIAQNQFGSSSRTITFNNSGNKFYHVFNV